jgi:1-acyl-sn-glycerol-3-phosphate acyltransferase
MIAGLRSALFYVGLGVVTPLFALPLLAAWPLPFRVREDIARGWCRTVLAWLRLTCGVSHRVEGLENLPPGPAVILSKHQSAWETIAFRTVFPAHLSWVLKRVLFRIPFYGWSLKALEEIGIDRGSTREALKQVETKGRAHLADGRWVVVFPEGTRMPPGEAGKYAAGGARLAVAANVPVVPVALNSGHCWPKSDWRKYPGTITLRIGPSIGSDGLSAAEVNRRARDWIEAQQAELDGAGA